MKNSKLYQAYAMLLFCGAGWALGTIIVKAFIENIGPFHLMFGRFLFAFAIVFAVKPSTMLRSSGKEALTSTVLGVIMYIAYATAIVSLKYTTASKSGFLIALPVVLVPVLQLLIHRKKPGIWVVATAVLSVAGLFMISDMDGIGFNWGDALAALSALAYSFYILVVDKVAGSVNEFTLVQFQLLIMCALSGISTFIFEGFNVNLLIMGAVPILVTGIFSTAMTLFFQLHAQREASPESVGLLLLSEPILTFFLAFMILHEAVTIKGAIGGAVIIGAMILAVIKKI